MRELARLVTGSRVDRPSRLRADYLTSTYSLIDTRLDPQFVA